MHSEIGNKGRSAILFHQNLMHFEISILRCLTVVIFCDRAARPTTKLEDTGKLCNVIGHIHHSD
jgi:hypothetical protein